MSHYDPFLITGGISRRGGTTARPVNYASKKQNKPSFAAQITDRSFVLVAPSFLRGFVKQTTNLENFNVNMHMAQKNKRQKPKSEQNSD